MRCVLLLAVVALAGCGSQANPVVRVVVAPWPEGPSLVVERDALPALPDELPANPPQECTLGGTVTLTLADGSRRRYGPCVLPPVIERLRVELVRAARTGTPPEPPSDWRALLKDWYDGRIDGWYPCAVVRAAFRHLPVDGRVYSTAYDDLSAYARAVCIR